MPGIIIEPMKAVYWPIPKNACTALKIHFAKVLGIRYRGKIHDAPFPTTKEPIDGYENFAFVRNPYARLYSLWTNKIAPGHPVADDYINGLDPYVFGKLMGHVYSGMPFHAFVNVLLSQKVVDPHWQPQVDQIPEDCNCFKLEEIANTLKHLIPQYNVSDAPVPWWEAYNDSLLHTVYEYYKRSFQRFGYARYGY